MIIVTGARGQLGTDVVKELNRRGIENIGIDISELDITDGDAVFAFFQGLARKRLGKDGQFENLCVIHCAAYTAVDKAEDEPELCFRVNADGTENIAKVCQKIGAEMIYISTDYVFSGEGDEPYETNSAKGPISIYGKSKLAGEEAVTAHLEKCYIVRISWVFGHADGNFVKTMLKLAETRDELNVVCDQVGSPTYTADMAVLLCDMTFSKKYGEYHATNEGYCSWAEFAAQIMRLRKVYHADGADADGMGADVRCSVKINPIPTEEYPTKATRPKNSKLSKKSLDDAGFARLPTWQDALERYMACM